MRCKVDQKLDCAGQLCPAPILMTEACFKDLAWGDVLEVTFTDPGAEPDLRAWCKANAHALFLGVTREGALRRAYLRKKDGPRGL